MHTFVHINTHLTLFNSSLCCPLYICYIPKLTQSYSFLISTVTSCLFMCELSQQQLNGTRKPAYIIFYHSTNSTNFLSMSDKHNSNANKRIIWASSNKHYINLAQNMATYFTLRKKNYLRLLRIPLTFKKINIGTILYYQRSSKNKCNSVDVVLTVMYFGKKLVPFCWRREL